MQEEIAPLLVLGDCIEHMKSIDSGSVDLVLCDPPYGTTTCKWDNVLELGPLWATLNRVIKPNGAIVLFATQPFSSQLVNSNLKGFKYSWYWKKSKASNFPQAPNMPLKIIEEILVFSNGVVCHASQVGDRRMPYYPQGITKGVKIIKQRRNTSHLNYHRETQAQHVGGYRCKNENYPQTLLNFKSENGHHPTQKPVTLLEYLIRTYTQAGDLVLDFTMGSGSTGVACKKSHRRFIGIEKDPGYFEIAEERIRSAEGAQLVFPGLNFL